MTRWNVIDDALDFAKDCEREWFGDCVWFSCPPSTIIRDVSCVFEVLGDGTQVEDQDGQTREVYRYRDFKVRYEDYFLEAGETLRRPKCGDVITVCINSQVCQYEVRGREEDLTEWDWLDNRKCEYRVRTILINEYTQAEWEAILTG